VALLDGCIFWLPEVDFPPPQEPEAEQEVALLLVQETTVLWPCWMLDGLAKIERLGAGVGALCVTATPPVLETLPPAPLQVRV
jgi:hypothetical protein